MFQSISKGCYSDNSLPVILSLWKQADPTNLEASFSMIQMQKTWKINNSLMGNFTVVWNEINCHPTYTKSNLQGNYFIICIYLLDFFSTPLSMLQCSYRQRHAVTKFFLFLFLGLHFEKQCLSNILCSTWTIYVNILTLV